jgi:ribonucleoside-diphosphate reductase alpha chain
METNYLNISKTAIDVIEKRYLQKNEYGNISETIPQMFSRVAKAVSMGNEDLQNQFYVMMMKQQFLPNSPTLMNAGTEIGMLSACFVLPIQDSMNSIFDTIKNAALIHKSGGGTGFSFSNLRPENDIVKTTSGVSSGPISFMKVYNAATEVVKQGSRRRGANMGILRIDHPDILKFIECKSDLNELNNFNISITVTDVFMEAVKNDDEYDIINPRNKEVITQYKAKEVFDKIIYQAWLTGEPGIIFIDRMNQYNPTPHLGLYEATNPCGEQILRSWDSCNLGSINISKFVKQEKHKDDYFIDYEELEKIVSLAVEFLDNIIDINKFPLPQIEEVTKQTRNIGLGVMGFADTLLKLKIPYSSEKGRKTAETIMEFINKIAYEKSQKLAEEKGSYPEIKNEIEGKIRNSTRTTIAPTGTISIIAGCSSGIEPIFSLAFVRRIMDGNEYFEVNPVFDSILDDLVEKYNIDKQKIIKQIAEEGTCQNCDDIPSEYKVFLQTAHDISPEEHILMQAAFQKHTNNAVSKTINFPENASLDDIKSTYLLAYEHGCKGVTVYRNNCRQNQVLNLKTEEKKKEENKENVRIKKERPGVLKGYTYKQTTGCGDIYITINEDEDGNVFEIFNMIGKAGGCSASQCEAIGRLISLACRSGQKPEEIVKQLIGISCHRPIGFGENKILSCADAIAKSLKKHINMNGNDDTGNKDIKKEILDFEDNHMGGSCPECGGIINFESGCSICHSCGYSACG